MKKRKGLDNKSKKGGHQTGKGGTCGARSSLICRKTAIICEKAPVSSGRKLAGGQGTYYKQGSHRSSVKRMRVGGEGGVRRGEGFSLLRR